MERRFGDFVAYGAARPLGRKLPLKGAGFPRATDVAAAV